MWSRVAIGVAMVDSMSRYNNLRWVILIISCLAFTWISLPAAKAQELREFQVDTERSRQVLFVSDAPLEDFEGVTKYIDGYVMWNPDQSLQTGDSLQGSFYFEVDLASLDTGIGLRNRDMREDYLETDEYPFAKYSGKLSKVTGVTDSTTTLDTSGELTIHGVVQERTIPVVITPVENAYRVSAEFSVTLPDHKIKIPKFMFLQIDETVELELNFAVKPVKNSAGE